MNENEVQGKKCFIITPIGNDNSDIFRKAKGVIESVIKPVLTHYGFYDVKPAYEINVSGMINTQIINRIIDDDLVIANLTGNNPNVMYELSLRHTVAKPIIHICEKGTVLPFDIKDNRTIFYENDMLGVEELKQSLMRFMDEIDYNVEHLDNPIYNAYRYGKLLKDTQDSESNEVLNLLVNIWGKVSELTTKQDSKVLYARAFPKAINTDSIYSSHENYSEERFNRDIENINKDSVRKLCGRTNETSMQICELSKVLNVSSKTMIKLCQKLGIKASAMSSTVDKEDIKKILYYITNGKDIIDDSAL